MDVRDDFDREALAEWLSGLDAAERAALAHYLVTGEVDQLLALCETSEKLRANVYRPFLRAADEKVD